MSGSAEEGFLVGREAEWGQLAGFADDVRRGPAVLVLEGAAGIGKTALWNASRRAAAMDGFLVLSCRAVEAEAQLSFSGLASLLEPVSGAALAGLPEPQRHAVEAALQRAEARGPSAPPLALSLGVLGALRFLAVDQPVLVAVDDVADLDGGTERVLGFLLRRLEQEPKDPVRAARAGFRGGGAVRRPGSAPTARRRRRTGGR